MNAASSRRMRKTKSGVGYAMAVAYCTATFDVSSGSSNRLGGIPSTLWMLKVAPFAPAFLYSSMKAVKSCCLGNRSPTTAMLFWSGSYAAGLGTYFSVPYNQRKFSDTTMGGSAGGYRASTVPRSPDAPCICAGAGSKERLCGVCTVTSTEENHVAGIIV